MCTYYCLIVLGQVEIGLSRQSTIDTMVETQNLSQQNIVSELMSNPILELKSIQFNENNTVSKGPFYSRFATDRFS